MTATIGSATLKDNEIINTFSGGSLIGSFVTNFLLERNDENIMKLKVTKFEVNNLIYLKEENGGKREVALTAIEGVVNSMSSMFNDGLSKK